MYTVNKRFEWDDAKAGVNKWKHGISFEEASEALMDPEGVAIYDKGHSVHEERFRWLGLSSKGLLLVVFTNRQEGILYRIISARCASRKERAFYHEKTQN